MCLVRAKEWETKCLAAGQSVAGRGLSWDHGRSMAWLQGIVDRGRMLGRGGRVIEVEMRIGVGCETAVCSRFAMAPACGATWRLLWELWFSCRSGSCSMCGVPPWFGVSQQLRTVRGFERAEIPDNRDVAASSTANRGQYVRRGQRLEYFTIAYNTVEGAASIVAGVARRFRLACRIRFG